MRTRTWDTPKTILWRSVIISDLIFVVVVAIYYIMVVGAMLPCTCCMRCRFTQTGAQSFPRLTSARFCAMLAIL